MQEAPVAKPKQDEPVKVLSGSTHEKHMRYIIKRGASNAIEPKASIVTEAVIVTEPEAPRETEAVIVTEPEAPRETEAVIVTEPEAPKETEVEPAPDVWKANAELEERVRALEQEVMAGKERISTQVKCMELLDKINRETMAENATLRAKVRDLEFPLVSNETKIGRLVEQAAELTKKIEAQRALISDQKKYIATLEVPSWALCPITKQIMRDPVTLLDNMTYERKAIANYLQNHKDIRRSRHESLLNHNAVDGGRCLLTYGVLSEGYKSPVTGQPLAFGYKHQFDANGEMVGFLDFEFVENVALRNAIASLNWK